MDDEDDDEEPRIDSLESEAFMSSLDVSLVSVPVFVLLICSRRRWWLAMPPLRPASRASSLVHSCAVPFWWAALPPLLAMSRCLARSIEAKPRSSFATCPPPPVPGASWFPLRCVLRAQPVQRKCHDTQPKLLIPRELRQLSGW